MSQELRAQFEADYFAYCQKIIALGWERENEDNRTPESLFWRSEIVPEMYGVQQVEAAWQGYQMRARCEVVAPVECPTYETSSGDYVVCRRCYESWPSGAARACVKAYRVLTLARDVA